MDIISKNDIATLLNSTEDNSISIYLPTLKVSIQSDQNPIRFKDQIKIVKNRLQGQGMRKPDMESSLQPLTDLLENHQFWLHQDEGLAVFLSRDHFSYHRLPISFPEYVYMNRNFYIKPLLPLLRDDGSYYVLALNLGGCRLYIGRQFHFHEISAPELQVDIDEVLKYDDPESQLQLHTGTPGPTNRQSTAIYHGHGVGTDESKKKTDIERYSHFIGHHVHRLLGDKNQPLILAGGEHLRGIYRQSSSYSHIFDQAIDINLHDLSPEQIHERSWELIGPYFDAEDNKLFERFQSVKNSKKASSRTEEIVPAAFNKRIDALFLARDAEVWGEFDPEKQSVRLEPGAETIPNGHQELSNLALIYTLQAKGTIILKEQSKMFEGSSMSAIFRY